MNMAFELKAARLADIPLQEASLNIWDTKYRLKTKSGEPVDRDIDGTYQRVAKALAHVEAPEKRGEWYERFLWALQRGATFEDGLKNQQVLDAVKQSTQSRSWVDLP